MNYQLNPQNSLPQESQELESINPNEYTEENNVSKDKNTEAFEMISESSELKFLNTDDEITTDTDNSQNMENKDEEIINSYANIKSSSKIDLPDPKHNPDVYAQLYAKLSGISFKEAKAEIKSFLKKPNRR